MTGVFSIKEMATENMIRERIRRAYNPEYQANLAEGHRDLEAARARDERLLDEMTANLSDE